MILKLPNKIYISSANVDMRKSIDGLVAIVQCNFSLDPIKRASQYIADKGIFTKEPKSKSSIRVLPMSTSMKKLLDSHKKWQANLKETMSEEWTDNDRLFTTAYGTPIHPDTVTGWFDKFIKQIEFPKSLSMGLDTLLLVC